MADRTEFRRSVLRFMGQVLRRGSLLLAVTACAPTTTVSGVSGFNDSIETDGIAIVAARGTSPKDQDLPACVAESLQEAEPTLRIVPAKEFRNAMFPLFEPSATPTNAQALTSILRQERVRKRIRKLEIRYLVLLSGRTETSDNRGGIGCGGAFTAAGCLGLEWWERDTRLVGTVWDLSETTQIGQVESTSEGSTMLAGLILPIPFFAATEAAACNAFARDFANGLKGKSTSKEN